MQALENIAAVVVLILGGVIVWLCASGKLDLED